MSSLPFKGNRVGPRSLIQYYPANSQISTAVNLVYCSILPLLCYHSHTGML